MRGTEGAQRRRRRRSIAIAAAVFGLAALFYVMAIVRMSAGP